MNKEHYLNEVCLNCGLTHGAHCATTCESNHYKMIVPRNYCPGHQGHMDWDKGPGTIFSSSGVFKSIESGTPCKRPVIDTLQASAKITIDNGH